MRIKRLSYENKRTGWKLEPMEFGDFNLLVGVSGVGKSKILEAIKDLYWVAFHVGIGRIWEFDFSIDNIDYHWSRFGIEREELISNGFAFERELAKVKIDGNLLPVDHNSDISLLQLFSSDKRIKPIFDGVRKIKFLSVPESITSEKFEPDKIELIVKDYTSLETVQNSGYSIHTKLVIAGLNLPNVFQQVKEAYIAIFPQVQDLRIVRWGLFSELSNDLATFEIQLKESGIDTWIDQVDISTGMLKTLLLIGAMYLSSPGSVILIDEFENSLGVNCIDIFDRIDYENRGLQFIITSHHPYIINSIPFEYWKIVTRKGNVVTVRNANEFERLTKKSLHDNFSRLLEIEEFVGGIA